MTPRDQSRERILRKLVAGVLALSLVAAIFSIIPGIDVYRDDNDCAGQHLGNVMTMETRTIHCASHYKFVDTELAGGPWILLLIAGLALPGLLVWRYPRWGVGLGWSGLSLALSWLPAAWLAFGPGGLLSFKHYVMRCPYWVLVGLVLALFTVVLFGAPIGVLYWWRTNRKVDAGIPEARLLDR